MKTPPVKSLLVGSRTDVGCIRDHNEDSLLVKDPLYVIADGMGGHAAGEIASEIAVQTLGKAQITKPDSNALRRAVAEANSLIIKGAQQGLGRQGMGTTLTAVVLSGDELLVAQIGDSRAYLLQNGSLRQITRDHSLVGELVAAGKITEEEARFHPNRSVITRALGSEPHVQPDLYEMRVHEGERLLLCSDGLNSMLDNDSIAQILMSYPDPQDTADALVKAANEAGGYDNTTVIVIDINKVDPRAGIRQKRRFRRGIITFVIVFLLLVGGALGGLYAYARNVAYLIDQDGYVTLYRGLPGNVMGVQLNWLEETTTIKVSGLNPATIQQLQDGIKVNSISDGQQIISQYLEQHQATQSNQTSNGQSGATQSSDSQSTTPTTPTTPSTSQKKSS